MTVQLSDLQEYALDLKKRHAARDDMIVSMKNIYQFSWAERGDLEQTYPHMRIVLSPDGKNKIKTAVRLITASHAIPSVPTDLQSKLGPDVADSIEKWASIILRQSDRIRGNPVSYDVGLSGLLTDEIHISLNDTKAMIELGGSKAQVERYKRINRLTPFLIDVHDPEGCYADHDGLGLTAWARCVKMTEKAIISQYGDKGKAALAGLSSGKDSAIKEHNVWLMYTLVDYAVWIEGSDIPIYNYEHELPVIPVVVHTVEGSRSMFTNIEQQRDPFLYTLWKSGLWNLENLSLSAQATTMSGALWPQLKFISQTRKAPDIDLSVPWGVFHLEPGESLDTWNKNLIDPTLIQMWQMASSLATQSTLYDQVAGAPLGPGASYSETALLNQAGRLPLVGIQRKGGWALGDILRMAALLYKDMGGAPGMPYDILPVNDIPDNLELEVNLDVSLPQDKLQQAGLVKQLEGKVPQEFLLEHILGIRQPGQMIKKLMDERATEAHFQAYIQWIMAQAQMQQQIQLQGMAQQAQAQQMQAQQMQTAAQQSQGEQSIMGSPVNGGIPREMLSGGMQVPADPRFAQGMPEDLAA